MDLVFLVFLGVMLVMVAAMLDSLPSDSSRFREPRMSEWRIGSHIQAPGLPSYATVEKVFEFELGDEEPTVEYECLVLGHPIRHVIVSIRNVGGRWDVSLLDTEVTVPDDFRLMRKPSRIEFNGLTWTQIEFGGNAEYSLESEGETSWANATYALYKCGTERLRIVRYGRGLVEAWQGKQVDPKRVKLQEAEA